MPLVDRLPLELVIDVPDAVSRDELFAMVAARLAGIEPGVDQGDLTARLIERERSPTATPEGVAFPHAPAGVARSRIAVVRAPQGVDFQRPGCPPATIILFLFGGSESTWEQVRLLARLARIVHREDMREAILNAPDTAAVRDMMIHRDEAHG